MGGGQQRSLKMNLGGKKLNKQRNLKMNRGQTTNKLFSRVIVSRNLTFGYRIIIHKKTFPFLPPSKNEN